MDSYFIFCVIVQHFITYFVFQIVPSWGGVLFHVPMSLCHAPIILLLSTS